MPSQSKAVGAEGVGLDHLGPGGDVGPVDLLHDLGLGQVQLVEGALEGDSAGVQLRAHGAVAQDRTLEKAL